MIDRFLDYLRYERNFSPRTVFLYGHALNALRVWLEAQDIPFEPATLTRDTVRSWFISLMDTQQPGTLRISLSALNTFYRYLFIKELIPETTVPPTKGLRLPKVPKKLPVFFLEKEMDECLALLDKNTTFDGVRCSLVVDTIYQTGLRRAEVVGLKDVDVDTEAMQLKVLGKGNKERIIPFGSRLAEKMTLYRQMRDARFGRSAETFFVNLQGRPLTNQTVRDIVHSAMAQVSTKRKLSPHVIRHTFATVMLNHGADLAVIKELLGHASLDTTEIYTHVTYDQLLAEYKKSHPRG